MEHKNPTFLSDEPIETADEDQFGHAEYVDSLQRILKEVKPPWHIGIFGKWGSGKSSIIKLLFNRLRKSDDFDDTIFVEFDAWSHAEGSIRTELLLTLDQAVGEELEKPEGVIEEDEITGRLYDVEEEEISEDSLGIFEKISEFISKESHLVVITLGIVILSAIFAFFGMPQVSIAVLTFVLAPLFVNMAEKLSDATDTLRRKFLYPRKEWSGSYERIFEDIVEESGAKRIVISIDNLDRCESETVLDVLLSLKTFMENDRCIYLIPCDDQALEDHIHSIDEGEYFEEEENEREFLRKFFQSHIRIPPFLPEDIEEYADEENKKLDNEFDNRTLDVITSAYINNPRRIKHALNRLTTLRVLAEEKEESEQLRMGRVTENLPFLAKISILEEEYPAFYKRIKEDTFLLNDINQFFNDQLEDSSRVERVKNLIKESGDEADGESRLEGFLRSTRRISADNPKPFINLSEPSYATIGSDVDSFLQHLRTGQEEEVYEDLKGSKSFEPYVDAISRTLEEYTSKQREQPLFGTIDTVFETFEVFDEDSKERLADFLGEYLTTSMGKAFLGNLDPKSVFPTLKKMPNYEKSIISEEYANLISQDKEFHKNILRAFIEYMDMLPSGVPRQVAENLESMDAGPFKSALEILDKSKNVKSKFIYTSTLEKSASLIDIQDKENEFTDTEYYVNFDDVAENPARSAFIDQLFELRSKYDGDQPQQIDQALAEELIPIDSEITQEYGSKVLDEIKDLVEERENQQPTDLVKLSFHFHPSFSNETREEFNQWISNIIQSWNVNNVQEIFNFYNNYDIELDNEQEVDAIFGRIPDPIDDRNFILQKVIPAVPEEFDQDLLKKVKNLIQNNDHDTASLGVQIFDKYTDRFEDVRSDLLTDLGQRAQQADNVNQKKEFLQPGVDIFQALDEPEQENYIDQLGTLLSGNSNDYQLYKELWNSIKNDADSNRREKVAADVLNELKQQFGQGQNPDQYGPLIEIIQPLGGVLSNRESQRFMERLSDQLTENSLNDNQKATVLNQIRGFDEFFDKESQIIDRIQNYLSQTNHKGAISSSKSLLDKIEKSVDLVEEDEEQVNEIRETYFETE